MAVSRAFNWAERFLRDCAKEKLKLDFLGLHYYGNVSSLHGEYEANYPPFTKMLEHTRNARDRYLPGVPLWMTEWGASYHVSNEPQAAVNGNHVGAAWSASFLDAMLTGGVDGALYLVTTDLRQPVKNKKGQYENVWGYPSLFVNPHIFGKALPKAPYHVFDMVSRLQGTRIKATAESTTDKRSVHCFASASRKAKRITALVWNYDVRIPEFGEPVERGTHQTVILRVQEAGWSFGTPRVRVRRWTVSEMEGNAYTLFHKGESLDTQRTSLPETDASNRTIANNQVDLVIATPPSSVSLVEITGE